ncbi:MAG: hypothetical protein [Microvirus sp.]|nr:MAG: hypothetical protein [Microvirus sp.]
MADPVKVYKLELDVSQLQRVIASLRLSAASCDRLAKREGSQEPVSNAYRNEAHEVRLIEGVFVKLLGRV